MVYVPIYDFAMDLQAKKMEWKRGEWYLGAKVITFNAGAGHIKGYDAATGKLVWSKSQSWPATSGMLATGGGLVFYGDPDGYFNAVNDETGNIYMDLTQDLVSTVILLHLLKLESSMLP